MVQKAFSQLPKAHKWAVISLAFIVLVLALFPSDRASASRNTEAALLEIGKRYELPIATEHLVTSTEAEINDDLEWKTFQVKRGDTLAKIFSRAGLSARDTYN